MITSIIILILSAVVWIKSCQGVFMKKTIVAAEVLAILNLIHFSSFFGSTINDKSLYPMTSSILLVAIAIYIFARMLKIIANRNIENFYRKVEEEKSNFWRRS